MSWTLGPEGSGEQKVRIRAFDAAGVDLPGSPFDVEATIGELRLEYVAGNDQQGIPDMDLLGGLEFRVVTDDESTTPVPDITVHFEVISGGGEIITQEVVTDATGSGYGLWKLGGYLEGDQEVTASLLDAEGNHVSGSPIHYTATFRPLRILEVTSPNCVADPGTACEEKRIKLVSDFGLEQFNIDWPIAGIPVNFEVLGGGSITPPQCHLRPERGGECTLDPGVHV